jgi:ribulose bisphosphate carboxylase small subunit
MLPVPRPWLNGVHIADLAEFIDKRREAARKENDQMQVCLGAGFDPTIDVEGRPLARRKKWRSGKELGCADGGQPSALKGVKVPG